MSPEQRHSVSNGDVIVYQRALLHHHLSDIGAHLFLIKGHQVCGLTPPSLEQRSMVACPHQLRTLNVFRVPTSTLCQHDITRPSLQREIVAYHLHCQG